MYAANPNLIYMQTTAMGEALYLAFFVWAVVYFSEVRARRREGSHEMWSVPGGSVPHPL